MIVVSNLKKHKEIISHTLYEMPEDRNEKYKILKECNLTDANIEKIIDKIFIIARMDFGYTSLLIEKHNQNNEFVEKWLKQEEMYFYIEIERYWQEEKVTIQGGFVEEGIHFEISEAAINYGKKINRKNILKYL